MTFLKNSLFAALFICMGMLIAFSAHAQEKIEPSQGDLLPVMSDNTQDDEGVIATPRFTDYPDLRLTSDKPVVLKLDADAANIIVGNTDHVGVLPDNPRNLVLIPRQPGSTFLQVMDSEGQTIMQRHIIVGVAKPKENYVRVRRSCRGDEDCEQYSMYYCPGMCHEMGITANRKMQQVNETNGATFSNEVVIGNENASPALDEGDIVVPGQAIDEAEDNFNSGNSIGGAIPPTIQQ